MDLDEKKELLRLKDEYNDLSKSKEE